MLQHFQKLAKTGKAGRIFRSYSLQEFPVRNLLVISFGRTVGGSHCPYSPFSAPYAFFSLESRSLICAPFFPKLEYLRIPRPAAVFVLKKKHNFLGHVFLILPSGFSYIKKNIFKFSSSLRSLLLFYLIPSNFLIARAILISDFRNTLYYHMSICSERL